MGIQDILSYSGHFVGIRCRSFPIDCSFPQRCSHETESRLHACGKMEWSWITR